MQSEDEAGPNALDVIEERGGREEDSRSSSPMEAPPVGGPLYGKRLSLVSETTKTKRKKNERHLTPLDMKITWET